MKFATYLSEVKAELQKATWPWDPKEKGFKKYKELTDSTIVVFIAMILMAGFVAFIDFAMRHVEVDPFEDINRRIGRTERQSQIAGGNRHVVVDLRSDRRHRVCHSAQMG